MQLLELALVLPFLLVLTAGVMDFAQGWNARQVLANAARDGARLGASQAFSDLDTTNPASIQAICQQVAHYLKTEHMSLAFMNNTTNSGSSSSTVAGMCSNPVEIANQTCTSTDCVPLAWTYYSSGTYGLKIEREVQVPPPGGSCAIGSTTACILSTRVTLKYPYSWGMGFNQIINLFGLSNYPATIPIKVYSTMEDLSSSS